MKAMVLERSGHALRLRDLPDPQPGANEIQIRVTACGVCRTDLHILDGELPAPKLPLIPGHEIVGRVEAIGPGVTAIRIGDRVGVPWLGHTCGSCRYCAAGAENLCDRPEFTGYTRDGGYATHAIASAQFTFSLGEGGDDVEIAPLLCAGLIGWRSLSIAGDGKTVGLYGFGAAAHIVLQVCRWQKRRVFCFVRPNDELAAAFALQLGADWVGGSDELPPEPLDAAIIYAPVGDLVPAALRAVRKGGRVVCAGIHMSDIPSFPYDILWNERQIVSVANLTRDDGKKFLDVAGKAGIETSVTRYPLSAANQALDDLRHGRLNGAAVLVP